MGALESAGRRMGGPVGGGWRGQPQRGYGTSPRPLTLNPKPQTLNPKHQTLNSKP
ncbi:hypothetical protein T484DRAFT_3332287 [Baffinella frigidus]|nr:hypothetical protein T484DRAFT_3332287 [Cryptophyta sp. CCMP2293]